MRWRAPCCAGRCWWSPSPANRVSPPPSGVTTVATLEPASLVVHGRQLTGQLAPELLERLGTAPWLLLQPDAGAEAALAMLQHPAAFPLDSAELTLAWEQRGAAGELWRTTLLLRGR